VEESVHAGDAMGNEVEDPVDGVRAPVEESAARLRLLDVPARPGLAVSARVQFDVKHVADRASGGEVVADAREQAVGGRQLLAGLADLVETLGVVEAA